MKKLLIFLSCTAALALAACTEETTRVLPTPANLSAVYDEDAECVHVTWSAVDGATAYIVYYNGYGETATFRSDPLFVTYYDFTNYTDGSTYEFKVRCANNNAVSEFTDIVSVTIPQAEADMVPAPEVDNIRPGIGWINLTIDAPKVSCTYALYDGDTQLDCSFDLIGTNEDGTREYCISGLELNKTYSSLNIYAVSDEYGQSKATSLGSVTTLNITKMSRNPSPCHLAIQWDDAAAGLDWAASSSPVPNTRAYQIQLATDANFENCVYDMYTTDGSAGAFTSGTWIGGTGDGSSQGKPYCYSPCAASFSCLTPATTYYFRVRSIDETVTVAGTSIDMNAPNGASSWSPAVAFTTEAAHQASANELLFQGFDDHCWQMDHINSICGIEPVGSSIDYTSGAWTGEFGLYFPGTGSRYDEIGAASTGNFAGNNSSKVDGVANYNMDTDIFPSMKGWCCSKVAYPMQGALKLGNNTSQVNYIMTPAFSDLTAATEVTISCDAGTCHACLIKSNLTIKIFRASDQSLDTVLDQELPNNPVEYSSDGSLYHFHVDMVNYSTTATLNPGDYILFECVSDSDHYRCAIDNLLVEKK